MEFTHPDILRAERFGSRDEAEAAVCRGCGASIYGGESGEPVFDGTGEAFCSETCREKTRKRVFCEVTKKMKSANKRLKDYGEDKNG